MSDNILGFPHGKRPGDYLPCDVEPPFEEPPLEGNGIDNMHLFDPVNHPAHYIRDGVETIDIIQHIIKPYPSCYAWAIGNVIKYLSRAMTKGTFAQDIEKAHWYLTYVVNMVRDASQTVR